MTCSFFTIVKTYFRCCITRDESDITKKSVYSDADPVADPNLFTFDDLSRPMSSSTSSSSSSLNDGYEAQPTTTTTTTTTTTQFQRVQAYKRSHFQPFIGIAPYYASD